MDYCDFISTSCTSCDFISIWRGVRVVRSINFYFMWFHFSLSILIKEKKKKNLFSICNNVRFHDKLFIPPPKKKKLGGVWFVFSNNHFQFLNNISRISIHFFTHTYFHKCFQTTIFSFQTHIPNGPLICVKPKQLTLRLNQKSKN